MRAFVVTVGSDEVDLAFTVDNDDDPRIAIHLLGHDPFVVLTPAGDVNGPRVTASELNRHPLDTKALAMIAVLAGVGAALRPLGAGTAG